MPGKNTADLIRSVLEKHKGFMTVAKLSESIGAQGRYSLGIKKGDNGKVIRRKIEQSAGDIFMFRTKGNSIYILEPCEPSELLMEIMPEKKAFDTKVIASLPFTKAEFYGIVNELIDEGRVRTHYDENGKPKIYRAESVSAVRPEQVNSEGALSQEYTQEKFREAFDALDMGRIFVRVCDLRRRLGWPREVFDEMLRELRDKEIIQLHTGDASLMTPDEVSDCFVDENNFRKGSVTWHAR